jgi:hypothetical protein
MVPKRARIVSTAWWSSRLLEVRFLIIALSDSKLSSGLDLCRRRLFFAFVTPHIKSNEEYEDKKEPHNGEDKVGGNHVFSFALVVEALSYFFD